MIKIQGIKKSFGEKKVLLGIDLNIEQGKISCIIGKSGCGKSVLLKNIVGLLNPDEGEIVVDNINISDLDQKGLFELRSKMGYVFQGAALFDSMSVYENTVIKLTEHGETDQVYLEKEAQKVLSAVGLLPYSEDVSNEVFDKEWEIIKNKRPSDLSGGMKKRVAVARALVGNPEYVFYDEPTTGLDPVTSEQIDDLIKDLADEFKITSVVITHDMFSVYRIADKVAMLHDGHLRFEGDVNGLRNSKDEVVQEFIERFN